MNGKLHSSDRKFLQEAKDYVSNQGSGFTSNESKHYQNYFNNNLNLINRSSRIIYLMPSQENVLKFGNPEQSLREEQTYQQYKRSEVGSLLVPNLYTHEHGLFNIQKKAHAIGTLNLQELDIMREVFNEYNLNVNLRNADEFGYLNDRVTPVLVDYGEI